MKHFSLRSEQSGLGIQVVPKPQLTEAPSAILDQIEVVRSTGSAGITEEKVYPFSIKVVLAGEETCFVGRQATRLKRGSILLIPHGGKLATQTSAGLESVTIHFPESLAVMVLQDETRLGVTCTENAASSELLRSFPMHMRSLPSGWEDMFRSIHTAECETDVMELVLQLLPKAVRLALEAQEEIARIPAIKRSAKIELFRRACLGRTAIEEKPSLQLGQLAEECCLSPFHLHRVFTAAFGATPGSYAKRRKMDISRSLLQGTEMPVKLIAHQAGFENPSAFVRSFRNEYGMTPLTFRKEGPALLQ